MLTNSMVQITAGKFAGTALFPGSALLISGIIIWRIWHNKQVRLQTETNELNEELRQIKEQMADLQAMTAKSHPDEKSSSIYAFSANQKAYQPGIQGSAGNMGLFEFLIEDNVQLRQQ